MIFFLVKEVLSPRDTRQLSPSHSIPGYDSPMKTLTRRRLSDLLAAFALEHHPLALGAVQRACADVLGMDSSITAQEVDSLRGAFSNVLARELGDAGENAVGVPEPSPGASPAERLSLAQHEVIDACEGFLHRAALKMGFSDDERREMLRGMLLTRAVDNRLKTFFSTGEVRFTKADGSGKGFQGKGFRSLGQEAIYAMALRLRRGSDYRGDGGSDAFDGWRGDVISPMIRDAGAALGMRSTSEAVRLILSAQMAKAGPPMNGKDLHVGDPAWGVLPPAAPLSIASLNIAGVAFALAMEAPPGPDRRVAVSFIGEGGSSLGEWHEAINLCAARSLPAIFCLQNNQTALSTPLQDQAAVRSFADKAVGYGIPGITLDGTDPEAIAAGFAWAAERARDGRGPTLIELVCMRMCGHAHHDDMLYLGYEPQVGWDYPELKENGYANHEAWAYWSRRDPIRLYAARLEEAGLVSSEELAEWKEEILETVESEAQSVVEASWPKPTDAGKGVYRRGEDVAPVEVLEERPGLALDRLAGLPEVDAGLPFDPKGNTFLEAVMLGVGDALRGDERAFVYGEDVGGEYGNAFLLLRPLLEEFGDRILNAPLTEAGTLGVCVGAALAGLRQIGEIQFNDFVATGFNQLVNNAAKIHYRWGGSVPMTVRMPWGGLRNAGPYHSQNTEAWFYRTPGIKIVVPSTPEDARAFLAAAVEDPDPVLYYEHIALYREPRIKQRLPDAVAQPLPLGKAALRRAGDDLLMVSYGAYVHTARRVAERLADDGIEVSVLDLRSLVPLDKETLLRCARHCGKVLIVQEDTRRGSIGESLAAILQEEVFEYLDAPVRVLGALDTPVPYAPSLEEVFLPSEAQVEQAARLLAAY